MKLTHKQNQGGTNMSFTTRMTEQFIQNMYQKTTGATKYTKNKSKTVGAQPKAVEEAVTYEKSASQVGKATYTKPVAVSQKNDKKEELQAKLNQTYESLSSEAKSYLETLKEKYGDHFVLVIVSCANIILTSRFGRAMHAPTCMAVVFAPIKPVHLIKTMGLLQAHLNLQQPP